MQLLGYEKCNALILFAVFMVKSGYSVYIPAIGESLGLYTVLFRRHGFQRLNQKNQLFSAFIFSTVVVQK